MLRQFHILCGSLLSKPFWRSKLGAWQAARFDRLYQTDTIAQLQVSAMKDVSSELAAHAVHYEASAIPKLRRALKIVAGYLGEAISEYNFVDFGSGKGLVVMLASRYRFRHVYGVEMTPELHRIAKSNADKYQTKGSLSARISLTCGDALQFELPEGNLVAYLYNPFDAVLMQRFVARLANAAAQDRQLVVIYVNPLQRGAFDRDERFHEQFDNGALCIFRYDPGTRTAGVAGRETLAADRVRADAAI